MKINLSKKSDQEIKEFISRYGINLKEKFPSNSNKFIETCINCGIEEQFSDSDLVL